MKCPGCGDAGESLAVRVWAVFSGHVTLANGDDGPEPVDSEPRDSEYDQDSQAECTECGHLGKVADFLEPGDDAGGQQAAEPERQFVKKVAGLLKYAGELEGNAPVDAAEVLDALIDEARQLTGSRGGEEEDEGS